MIKIKVFTGLNYSITEVTEDTYKLIEDKVIKSLTKTVELQTYLQESNFTLTRLMESCITIDIYNEAIKESIEIIKQQKI